ncbi:hypothetical protein F0L74_17470 [Chitinophaga agrisoli]|uniref:Uncharacterized protein n=1 Tax=Chitinophaga agrisoli TaxID=2607653 RepID=A0A5B2VTS4_9BACT|nr:hypothetical protein [Chitinophaga agrisoli]KAA2241667.1 hypothetical protein F0L74_17470 [Chitinophaga agrisoli]
MTYPIGQYLMDGADLWLVYGVTISAGSDDLMKFPARKDSISHDWEDENGIDIDLSRVFFQSREASFQCNIIANDETDFWQKYSGFLAMLAKPDLRRLEIAELSRSFYVYYKGCNSFTRFTRIKSGAYKGKITAQFSIALTERAPVIDSSNVYVVEEQGRFIIT